MKLAELKRRLVPGTKLRIVRSLMGPCDKARVVARTNSVDVMFTGDGIKPGEVSHLAWPKASQLHETPDGFEIREDNGEVSARYVWVRDVWVRDEPIAPKADPPPDTKATEGRAFFVSAMNDSGKAIALAGPFETFGEAKAAQPKAEEQAAKVDPRAPWYSYGTCQAPADTPVAFPHLNDEGRCPDQ